MKLINKYSFFVFLVFTCNIIAMEESPLKEYFETILDEEISKFYSCIEAEGLKPINQINTSCKESKLHQDAYFMINNRHIASPADSIQDLESFKKIATPELTYPQQMNEKRAEGYVLLSFDINKLGKVENIEVVDELCGDIRNPFTEYKKCTGFTRSAIKTASGLLYAPLKYKGEPLRVNGVKHRFSFVRGEGQLTPVVISGKERAASIRSQKAIKSEKYDEAFLHATKPGLAHRKLDFFASKAKFFMQHYEESSNYMELFLSKSKNSSGQFSELMMVESLSILIASLFNQNKFNEIIWHEKNYRIYLEERDGFKEALATTNLYIGIAFINTGNLHDGIFYLGMALKSSNSQDQKDYILNLYNQVSNYL